VPPKQTADDSATAALLNSVAKITAATEALASSARAANEDLARQRQRLTEPPTAVSPKVPAETCSVGKSKVKSRTKTNSRRKRSHSRSDSESSSVSSSSYYSSSSSSSPEPRRRHSRSRSHGRKRTVSLKAKVKLD
jgi:hypothetical protein